ncbi:hypothetical protein [Microbispora sp. NPDC049125]|uniref:hypothetical protein n=1 Tax=Microbispora sp. NPDC049125 TaxID=3154929 RepID=UPI0034652B56
MPDERQLPSGPRRGLTAALHDLYALAGKPAVRKISTRIRERDDLPGTLSHEGVSAVLRGVTLPRWDNLESLVRVLVEQQRVGEADVEMVVMHIHTLWRAADGGPVLNGSPLVPSAIPETGRNQEVAPAEHAPQGVADSADPSEEMTPQMPAQALLLRLRARQQTIDVFDREVAVEIIKRVGGANDAT